MTGNPEVISVKSGSGKSQWPRWGFVVHRVFENPLKSRPANPPHARHTWPLPREPRNGVGFL